MVLSSINDLLLSHLQTQADGENYRRVDIPVKPVAAGRPRLSKYGTYYPKNYTEFRNAARAHVGDHGEPLDGALVIVTDIRFPSPKKSTNLYPLGDVDNICKGVFDTIVENKTVIVDDRMVIGAWLNKRYAESDADVGITAHIFKVGAYKR